MSINVSESWMMKKKENIFHVLLSSSSCSTEDDTFFLFLQMDRIICSSAHRNTTNSILIRKLYAV